MNPPPGASTIDALVQTVQRCWPDADEVRLVSRRDPEPPSGSDVLDFAVVPAAASARLLAPVGRRAASAALARYSSALSTREVTQRLAVGAVTSLFGPVMLADRVRVFAPGADHLGAVIEEVVGEPVQLSLGIGTARANRKPVLGAFDRRGRPVAFVKVGDSPVAATHVAAEAAALEELGRHDWTVVVPPTLLGRRHWRGMDVVVMSALPARPWQGRDGRWPIPDAAMTELCQVFSEGSAALSSTPWWHRLVGEVASLRDPARRDLMSEVLERVERGVGSVEVPVGAWHGDFTPWNMSRAGSRLLLWDWERFETGVPVGMDRLHYAVNTLARERSFGVGTVLEGLRRGAAGDGPSDLAVAAAYLAALATRYLSGAQEQGGDVIADRADLVLRILTELSRHLGHTSPEQLRR